MTGTDLTTKHCVPCEGGMPPLEEKQEDALHQEVSSWLLLRDGNHKLRRQFSFKTFLDGIEFVNKVAKIAESEGHHPDVSISYNKIQLDLFTHAVGGLSENDFIMAAKIDKLVTS